MNREWWSLVLFVVYACTVVAPNMAAFCRVLPELSESVGWMDLLNWFTGC